MSTLTATPISESSVITAYNRDTASNADINTFTSAFKSVTDAIIIDLATLNTDKVDPDDSTTFTGNNTFSGTNTFSAATTFSGNITFAGNLVSSATSKTINFNTNVVTNIGAASATTDAIQYQQAVKATGSVTENITGVKTFTTALPICSVVPASGSDLVNKTYVDLQVFGNSGITQATSAPATTSGALWLNTTSTANYELFRGDGSAFAPITGIFQGSSAPTAPTPASSRLWIDTTSTDSPSLKRYNGSAWKQCIPATIDAATTFTSAVTMSASTVFSAGFSVASSQTIDFNSNRLQEVGTPTASTDGTNKSYVDGRSPKIFSTTASKSINNQASPVTFVAAGDGSVTIAANTLEVGDILVWEVEGYFTTGAGASTVVIYPGISGQTYGNASCTPANNLTNSPFKFRYIATVRTIGAPGTIIGQGKLEYLNTTSPPAAWLEAAVTVATATTNLTTTSNRDMELTISTSSADSTWVATNTNFYVYK